jgi:hypothetical protein
LLRWGLINILLCLASNCDLPHFHLMLMDVFNILYDPNIFVKGRKQYIKWQMNY